MNPKEEAEFWKKMSDRAWKQAQDLLDLSDRYWDMGIAAQERKEVHQDQ